MRQSSFNLILLLGVLVVGGCSKVPLGHDKLVYSAVGASDVLGVGAFPLANGYSFRIQEELQDQGREVALVPIGVPAANTDIIADIVEAAADNGLHAELATVWVGANDLINGIPVETFAFELDALLSSLQEGLNAYVVLANLPSLPDLPGFVEAPLPEVTDERIKQYNAIIEVQAAARGIPVVNLGDDAIEAYLVSDFDGFHPDDQGHERLAKLFMNTIRPAL